jgi:hypothetical protein
MSLISNAVRSAVRTRLADPATGFNPVLAALCLAPYALDAYEIDFTDSSTNFWQSYVTADNLDESDADEGTLMLLYTRRSQTPGPQPQKFSSFSGIVEIGLDVDISWASSAVPLDTDSLADATEDTLINVFNASANYGAWASNGVLYNGEFQMNRQALRASGASWRQRLECIIGFELVAS